MRRRDFIILLAGASGWPSAVRAQQKAMPVIGFLGATSPGPFAPSLAAFHQGLGRTREFDCGCADGRFRRSAGILARRREGLKFADSRPSHPASERGGSTHCGHSRRISAPPKPSKSGAPLPSGILDF